MALFERVLIIGVGFMGGSLALALRKKNIATRIYGLDINPDSIRKGLERKAIDEGSVNIEDIPSFDPDLVVLASPVRTFRKIAEDLRGKISSSCIVTDLGSVKGHLVFELEKILGSRYVGGHPIAGTEKSGVEHSLEDLFEGKKAVITPTSETDPKALEKVRELWQRVGSKVELMDPVLHDWIFGAVSHLPHAVAFALIDALIHMSDRVDLFKYPGAGFRDFTRIAASDPVMWRDIFLENKDNVLKAIDVYINSLSKLRELIAEGKEELLTDYLREAKTRRLRLEQE